MSFFKKLLRPRMLLIIGVIAALCYWGWQTLYPKKTPPQYLTADVVKGDIEDTVLAAGVFQAQKLVSVGAQTSGEVKVLHVGLGDTVKKGQVIAEIDDLTQRNSLKNAQAALISQKAQREVKLAALHSAALTRQREKTMLAQDATSRQAFETADATWQTAKAEVASLDAQINQAKITVDTAQLNINHTQVLAPIDGTVVQVTTQQGQTVNANQSTPTIVQLANLNTLTIKAQISEADVVKVHAGMPVYFTILGDPDTKHYGTLRAIEPAPEVIAITTASSSAAAIYYNGLVDVPNPDGKLRINMTAQVYVILQQVQDATIVPSAAVKPEQHGKNNGKSKGKPASDTSAETATTTGNATDVPSTQTRHQHPLADGTTRSIVRVVGKDGLAETRHVTIGLNNRVSAEVRSGLAVGDQVIIGEETGDKPKTSKSRRSGF